ncbi:hypothetical protein PCANC_01567 [Puccinia coronata f. sp. avenae]|uniref:Uncharacterized protein n=1 Tax=Puccinia coronata f. sp. avenae TaxID=200324 RepID=A0A2N5W0G5_9BASI|nr:hypothetical protein PCANC_01567 [Puccinia coronata f. sp. avenae]
MIQHSRFMTSATVALLRQGEKLFMASDLHTKQRIGRTKIVHEEALQDNLLEASNVLADDSHIVHVDVN